MENKIIIAGFGGQGVQSLGMFIAFASIHDGKEVTFLPSYGPEMRGGTSNCSVVVSDKPVASPIIARPDILIAMNKPSLAKFEPKVKPGGCIIVNSSLIEDKVQRTDVDVYYVDANRLAQEAGNAKTANIVVLGAYTKISGVFTPDVMKAVIEHKFAKKPKVIPANFKAFDLGYALE
ncbi:MAG: 2-oxoacid:acceptor oxidoreductase family protein [Clostridia bacterium]|nr:2-oxoacid:acceptor oxidoreductase family protein [Clostridia bacterium]